MVLRSQEPAGMGAGRVGERRLPGPGAREGCNRYLVFGVTLMSCIPNWMGTAKLTWASLVRPAK